MQNEDDSELRSALLEHLSAAVVAVSASGLVVAANRAASSMLWPDGDAPSLDRWAQDLSLFLPDCSTPVPAADNPVVRALAGESPEPCTVVHWPRRTSRPQWLVVSASPIRDEAGGVRCAVVLLRDASSEAKLRAEAARLRAILESAPDQIYVLDLDGTIRFVNYVVAGFDRTSVERHNWLEFIPADYRGALRAVLARIGEGQGPERFDVLAPGVHHEINWFSSHVAALREDGQITGAVAVARNVTERRHNEAQLIASDRLASLGTLSTALAHEINNPLAAVVANLELLGRFLPEGVAAPEVSDMLTDATQAAHRVCQIVRDLRVFAKPEEAGLGPVNVGQVLESTLRIARNEVRHRAKLVLDLEEVPPVLAVESRLGQVFLNLIVNAAQAITEGRADENQITIRVARTPAGAVAITVRDTGVGITEELRARLFTPFFSTKPVGEGTGLGLAISKQIVTSMGGEISVESTPGVGSAFTVLLRAAGTAAAQPAAQSPSSRTKASRRGRVLVIDDEPMMLSAIQRLLSGDHDVQAVGSAAEALAILRSGRTFDVVLCDVMMPHMTGVDFYEELTTLSPDLARRVVFLTGGAFTTRAREFLEKSPNPTLAKPFNVTELRAIVKKRLA